MQNELLYIEEHLSCQNYMATVNTGFKYIEFSEDAEFGEDNANKNYLLFFLKGDFTINCNQFHNRIFHAGDMILIPRSAHFKGVIKGKASILSIRRCALSVPPHAPCCLSPTGSSCPLRRRCDRSTGVRVRVSGGCRGYLIR